MPYLFNDHQRAMAPLLFRGVAADSQVFRAAAALPKFGDPPMVPVPKPVPELTIGLLVESLGPASAGTNRLSARMISLIA